MEVNVLRSARRLCPGAPERWEERHLRNPTEFSSPATTSSKNKIEKILSYEDPERLL
jgi:hypothetical protein